jgi:predicted porin
MFAKNVLVAAAALVATVAAQAQTVNVYGNVDVSVGSFEDNLTNRITEVRSGQLTGSFIGFKGQEDLGGGLKAFFKLESTIGVDTGSAQSNFWGRTSELGLTGAYGTITGGNSVSLAGRAYDAQSPFSFFGNMNGVASTVAFHGGNFGAVQTNSLTYTSQTYSGFAGAAQFGTGTEETSSTDKIYALQGTYASGPLAAGLTVTNNDLADQNLVQLGGSYDFGSVKAFGQIGRAKLAANDDLNYFELGASVPVAANCKVLAAWTHGKSDGYKTDDLSVAYDHTLSKRTGAYAGLVYQSEKFDSFDSDSGISLAVGLRHAF